MCLNGLFIFVFMSINGAWQMIRDMRFSENSAIEVKYKDLISLGVSSQIPCGHCAYFDTESAQTHGASQQEISESIYIVGLTKVGSTMLNGAQADFDVFRKEVLQALQYAKGQMDKVGSPPPEDVFVKKFASAQEAYRDVESTFGFVPKFILVFPDEIVAALWSDMKGLLLNPHTAVPGRYKEFIGLAVASQIPCRYTTFFYTESARTNGATDREIHEAIATGALAAHWSSVFNGLRVDQKDFQAEFAPIFQRA